MCLPRNPGAARVRGDCEKVYTAGGVLDEKQYVQPRLSNVSTQKKSVTTMPCARAARNGRQMGHFGEVEGRCRLV